MRPPDRLRVFVLLAALGLVGALVLAFPASPQTSTTSLTVAVMGDLGITGTTERNVNLAVASGAQGLIGLGDYNYDASLRGWNAVVQPLTDRGAWFALGNHDVLAYYQSRMPGGAPQWSILLSGVRIVAINTQESVAPGTAQHAWLTAELAREPASSAKILVAHKPWWLGPGAQHPASQFPGDPAAMDALAATKGVDMVLMAHEHNYQRTQRNNIPYLIVGTGGASLYPIAGADPATLATCVCYGHVQLTLGSTQLSARFVDVDGVQRDAVTVSAATIPTTSTTTPTTQPNGFTATFKNVRGNDWWVETDVTANQPLAGVDARKNGGTWTPLLKRSWGSWAESINAPPGSTIQFRATSTTGASVLSITYAWPPA